MKNSLFIYIALIFFLLSITTAVFAGQKYNPYTGKWETVSPDAELNYNPYSRAYEYAPKDSEKPKRQSDIFGGRA